MKLSRLLLMFSLALNLAGVAVLGFRAPGDETGEKAGPDCAQPAAAMKASPGEGHESA